MKLLADKRPRKWLVMTLGSAGVILAAIGILAGIGFLKYRQVQAAMAMPPPPEMPVSVTLAKAEATTFRRSSVVVGSVLASQSIRLRTELTGVVTEVPMVPGKTVKQGDVLVRFDIRTEQAELKSAEASRKLAESAFQRAQELARASANSAQELDAAAAELTRSDAAVERLRVLIDKKTLVAPFDARVGLFNLHVGQYLESGTEITTLEGIADYFHIDFAMPAHVADSISLGDAVRVRAAWNTPDQSAVIVAIDSQADPVSRSVTARAKLSNPPPMLQPNDSVRVIVDYGPPIAAQAIPATAIRRSPTGTLVYVAVEQEGQLRAQARKIELAGGGNGVLAWVAQGIEAEEKVVADGSFKVADHSLLVDANAVPTAAADKGIDVETAAQEKREDTPQAEQPNDDQPLVLSAEETER